jgi:hypothetical protein
LSLAERRNYSYRGDFDGWFIRKEEGGSEIDTESPGVESRQTNGSTFGRNRNKVGGTVDFSKYCLSVFQNVCGAFCAKYILHYVIIVFNVSLLLLSVIHML